MSGLQGSRGQYRGGSDDCEDSDLESSSASDAEDSRVVSPSPFPAGISACGTYESSGSTAGASGGWGLGFEGVVWVGSPHILGGDIVGILGVKEGLGRKLFPLPISPSFSPLVVSGLVVLPSPVYGGKRSYRELNSN